MVWNLHDITPSFFFLDFFCCSNRLVIGYVVSIACTLHSGVSLNGLGLLDTIQYKLQWKPCFSLHNINKYVFEKKIHCISGVPINNLLPIRKYLRILGGMN